MKYTFIKQQDATDCAAACLAMVCLHYKKETTITLLRDMMGTDIRGTNLVGLSKCADKLGFVTQAIRVDREGFMSQFTLPAIANVITKEGLSHFVVIFKKDDKYVVIGDPAENLKRLTIEDFYKRFTGVLMILKPDERFVTGKNKGEKVFARYVRLLFPHKKLFIYGIIASLLLTIFGILSSLINSVIYDEILPYRQENVLRLVILIFAGIGIAQTVVGFIRQWMMIHLSVKIDIPLMLGYFEHIYKLPMRFFSTRKTGDITTRFSDAFTIKDIFTNIALTLVIDVFMALITGVILFNMSFSLFMVLLFMTITSILLVLVFKYPFKKINEEQMQQSAILNSQIIEGLRAVETIKGNASEKIEMENIEREYIKSLRISVREGHLSNVQSTISNVVSTIGNLVMTYVGISQVINGNMSLGTMMAFTTLAGYFMDPVGRLVSLQLTIQEANISMKRIAEILDYEREQDTSIEGKYSELERAEGDIEIKNVTFRYGNRKPVLKNISVTIPAGQKVAVVGSSGSGKSTLAKLLLKYYEPESGEIIINGIDIAEVTNESLRKSISYVPQNIELFSKSIYDNIRISKMSASLDEVREAAKAAGAHEFVRKLPMQYYTFLEEAGNGLSGGEKQRIALARAFLKNNDFYILDESTSNLDFATENIIFDMIYNRFRKKTMLIIAHRLSTIKNCDKIILLESGEVAEIGSHDELMALKGRYYHLWEMQQGNFDLNQSKETDIADEIPCEDEVSYF